MIFKRLDKENTLQEKAYTRIYRCIKSCETINHINFTERLIDRFNRRFGKLGDSESLEWHLQIKEEIILRDIVKSRFDIMNEEIEILLKTTNRLEEYNEEIDTFGPS